MAWNSDCPPSTPTQSTTCHPTQHTRGYSVKILVQGYAMCGQHIRQISSRSTVSRFVPRLKTSWSSPSFYYAWGFIWGLMEARKRIPAWLWVLLENEDEWEEFPSGSIYYQVLLEAIKGIPTKAKEHGKLNYTFKGNTMLSLCADILIVFTLQKDTSLSSDSLWYCIYVLHRLGFSKRFQPSGR